MPPRSPAAVSEPDEAVAAAILQHRRDRRVVSSTEPFADFGPERAYASLVGMAKRGGLSA